MIPCFCFFYTSARAHSSLLRCGIILLLAAASSMPLSAQYPDWININSSHGLFNIAVDGDYIWAAGTLGGIARIDTRNGEVEFFTKSNSGIPFRPVSDILLDRRGVAWFTIRARSNGWDMQPGGLLRYDGSSWVFLSTEDGGLPFAGLGEMAVDSKNTLWVISSRDIAAYDGVKWQEFGYGPPSGRLTALAVDPRDRIWVGGESGLTVFDGMDWRHFDSTNAPLPTNYVSDIVADPSGVVWVGMESNQSWVGPPYYGGLARFDGANWQVFDSTNSPLVPPYVELLAYDSTNDELLVLNDGRLLTFNGSRWSTIETPGFGYIQDLAVTPKGVPWVAVTPKYTSGYYSSRSGLLKREGATWVQVPHSPSALPGDWIRSMAVDRKGRRWIATVHGLGVFDGKNWESFTIANSPLSEGDNQFVAVDPFNRAWISSQGKVFVYNGMRWVEIILESPRRFNNINDALFTRDGKVWLCTSYGGLAYFDGRNWQWYTWENSPLPSNVITAIERDSAGVIWLGTWWGLVAFDGSEWVIYNRVNSPLESSIVTDLVLDSQNRVWVGTEFTGVYVFDRKNWTHYSITNSNLPSNYITSLAAGDNGRVWVGTRPMGDQDQEGGLALWNGQDFTVFDTDNSGLPNQYIETLMIDGYGNVWVGTRWSGIAVYREGGVILLDTGAEPSGVPSRILLSPNYPNPFSSSTFIPLSLKPGSRATARIFNALGQSIRELRLNTDDSGITWDGRDDLGNQAPGGVYFIRVVAGNEVAVRRMLLVR